MEKGTNKLENGFLWEKIITFAKLLCHKTFALLILPPSPILLGKIKENLVFSFTTYIMLLDTTSQQDTLGIHKADLRGYSQRKVKMKNKMFLRSVLWQGRVKFEWQSSLFDSLNTMQFMAI